MEYVYKEKLSLTKYLPGHIGNQLFTWSFTFHIGKAVLSFTSFIY